MKRFVPTTICLLLGSLLFPAKSWADVQAITISVDGVVCPVCAHSLNMGLRQLSGVKSVKVLMEARVKLDVRLHPGVWIDPTRYFQQISQVGYRGRPDEVKLRLRGTVAVSDDHLVLTMTDVTPGPISFVLAAPDTAGKRGNEIKLTMENVKGATKESGGSTRRVDVEGWWHSAKAQNTPPTIELTQLQFLP